MSVNLETFSKMSITSKGFHHRKKSFYKSISENQASNRKTFSSSFSINNFSNCENSPQMQKITFLPYFERPTTRTSLTKFTTMHSSSLSLRKLSKARSTNDILTQRDKFTTPLKKNKPKFRVYKFNTYQKIFRDQNKIFISKKPLIDNKLNICYAENQEQYKQKLLAKSKTPGNRAILSCSSNENFECFRERIENMKKKVSFLKCFIDYAYPDSVITKNKLAFSTRGENLLKFIPGYREIDEKNLFRNKVITNSLYEAIDIKPLKDLK